MNPYESGHESLSHSFVRMTFKQIINHIKKVWPKMLPKIMIKGVA